ncbi:MAG: hypothetical protein ABIA92_01700 [Patescibacteria group bacterium]
MIQFFDFGNDPKDYPNYDDYRKALEVREQFMDLSQKATDVIDSSKTDEEMRDGMEALGFTWHEDETCGREWCEKNDECLWCAVLVRQEECDKVFFSGLLREEDRLISKEVEEGCLGGEGCDALPPSWHQEGTQERRAILWFLRTIDALTFDAPGDLPFDEFHRRHPEIDEFVRQVYLCTLHCSRRKEWAEEELGRKTIGQFLIGNHLLPRQQSDTFLATYRTLL